MIKTKLKAEKAFLVGVNFRTTSKPGLTMDESLEELVLLSHTAGLKVIGMDKQRLEAPHPATYIGTGKVEEIKAYVENLHADIVIFDDELSPRHFRELEKILGKNVRVLDRTGLILDIFAQHAHTREGKIQVELAQYEYLYPRLTRAWTHLARQAGGGGGRSGSVGGVGLRGPGETQLEVDRRKIREKINRLKEEIEKVRDHRKRYRENRKRSNLPVVALVGYTNAGKSTLINTLTKADVYIADQLFATLDPTTRRLQLPGGKEILITDTVGFIQKLPAHLIASFRATLEEINEADLLIHVVDISHRNAIFHSRSVIQILKEIEASEIPIITALNKIDVVSDVSAVYKKYPEFNDGVQISAKTGEGINNLVTKISEVLFETYIPIRVSIPYREGQLISMLHEFGQVEKINHGVGKVDIVGKIPGRLLANLKRYEKDKEK